MEKTDTESFIGGKFAAKDSIDRINVLMKKFEPRGVVCPCPPGAVYILYEWSSHMTKMAAMPIYGKNL